MGRTACTEFQWLYKGALYLYLTWIMIHCDGLGNDEQQYGAEIWKSTTVHVVIP